MRIIVLGKWLKKTMVNGFKERRIRIVKTNIEMIKFNNPYKSDWSLYLFPTIFLDYAKYSYLHGKQFVIAIGFLFWSIEIKFSEH